MPAIDPENLEADPLDEPLSEDQLLVEAADGIGTDDFLEPEDGAAPGEEEVDGEVDLSTLSPAAQAAILLADSNPELAKLLEEQVMAEAPVAKVEDAPAAAALKSDEEFRAQEQERITIELSDFQKTHASWERVQSQTEKSFEACKAEYHQAAQAAAAQIEREFANNGLAVDEAFKQQYVRGVTQNIVNRYWELEGKLKEAAGTKNFLENVSREMNSFPALAAYPALYLDLRAKQVIGDGASTREAKEILYREAERAGLVKAKPSSQRAQTAKGKPALTNTEAKKMIERLSRLKKPSTGAQRGANTPARSSGKGGVKLDPAFAGRL